MHLNADGTISYKLIVANITNMTQAHIHKAPPGVAGGIKQWPYPVSGMTIRLLPGRTERSSPKVRSGQPRSYWPLSSVVTRTRTSTRFNIQRGRSADGSEHNTDLIAVRGSCHAAKPPVESH